MTWRALPPLSLAPAARKEFHNVQATFSERVLYRQFWVRGFHIDFFHGEGFISIIFSERVSYRQFSVREVHIDKPAVVRGSHINNIYILCYVHLSKEEHGLTEVPRSSETTLPQGPPYDPRSRATVGSYGGGGVIWVRYPCTVQQHGCFTLEPLPLHQLHYNTRAWLWNTNHCTRAP